MSDESGLDQAVIKAARAQELLDNELLTETFKTLEENYASAWRATVIDDVAAVSYTHLTLPTNREV